MGSANLVPPRVQQRIEEGLSYCIQGVARWPSLANCGGRTRWGVESRRGPIFCAVLILCSSVTNHVHALLGLSEEGFGAFDQADPSANPSGDLGDPDLSKTELLSVGTSSRV